MPKSRRAFARVPTRVVLVIMIFLGMWITYMLRVNISLAAIAMVHQRTALVHRDNCSVTVPYGLGRNENLHEYIAPSSSRNRSDVYDWGTDIIGHVFAAYYVGYFITVITGYTVSMSLGCKWLVFVATAVMSILHIVTPLLTHVHWGLVCADRFLMGLCAGFIVPAMHLTIGYWAPPEENRLFIWAMLGGTLGVIFTWPISAIIIEDGTDWEITFYYTGSIAVAWCILWALFVYDRPENHPWISDNEIDYILSSVASNPCLRARGRVPWGSLCCSTAFWGLILLQYSNMAFLNFLLIESPAMLHHYLGFSYVHSGFLSSVMFMFRLVGGFLFTWIAEYVKRMECLGMTSFRKMFVVFSHMIPGIILLSFWFTNCHPDIAVVVLCLSIVINGAVVATSLPNAHDLAPDFSGTLNDVVSWIAMTSGFIVPETIGWVLKDKYTAVKWRIIIMAHGGQFLITGLLFLILGKGNVQSWNELEESPEQRQTPFDGKALWPEESEPPFVVRPNA